jgi:signal transduction histidine kinase/ligand-binding sensor domain-containing protein/DNA-binding NarL/FixJ family response regulator
MIFLDFTRHKIRMVVFLLFIVSFSTNLYAVNFYSINRLYRISMRETHSICKDDNGFIWASSKFGIIRLTKDDYRIYSLPYESANVLLVRMVYDNSKLIAYTFNGQIFQYNPVLDKFELFFNLGTTLNNIYIRIQNIALDDSGTYWIASSVGLFKYQSGKLTFIEEMTGERYSMSWYDEQHLLIAKPDGIWLFDVHSEEFIQLYKNNEITTFTVSSLNVDKNQNKIWLGTLNNGLYNFDFNTKTLSRILKYELPTQPILSIEANSDTTFLIGIDGQGIWEINKSGEKILNVYKEDVDNLYSLNGNGVYDLLCDDNNRVWISTYSGGISFFDQATPFFTHVIHQTNNPNSLINNNVNCIIEDRWGKLWFATNNGISCWNITSNTWKNYYANSQESSQVFLTLCEDNQGRIWAGTYSSGVYVLDGKTGKELAHHYQSQNDTPTVGNFIFDIYNDSQGDLWLGSNVDNLVCYQSKDNQFRVYEKEPVSKIGEISPNQILLGCTYGLLSLNKETGVVSQMLLDISVIDFFVKDDIIWICTNGDGLIRFNYKNNETKIFNTESGLPSNHINSIIYTDGNLWLGTENGLCCFNPDDYTINTFPALLSMSTISFNSSSPVLLNNGELAWSTNNGALFFLPNLIENTKLTGRIFFQDITLSGRSIREIANLNLDTPVDSLQNLKLKYSQNNISFELLPISSQSGMKFSWILEGFDEEWTLPTSNRLLTYTNLPSGKFTLKIRLHDGSLSQVISERSISIKLVPPFWRKAWFYILISVVASGLIFLYLLYYINRLKQTHTEEKVRFFTNTAHDIRTSLTLIKGPVEELSSETNLSKPGQNYLRLAIEQVRQLSFVVTQLMDFQKVDIGKEQLSLSMVNLVELTNNRIIMFESFAKSKEIEITFTSNRDQFFTAVDEIKIEKIVDNLMSNAVKYSHPESKVNVGLICNDNNWVLQVKDQGIGINRKAQRKLFKEFYRSENAMNSKVVGSGIGLLLSKKYVTMHGGNISCVSQENVGSTFQVDIPFKTISVESYPIEFKNTDLSIETHFPSHYAEEIKNNPVENINNTSKEIKILVVEDNDDLLNFMHNTLSREFKVYSAGNGEKAWEFISRQLPDLVISDIMMPRMDGFELCRLMKSTYETSHIPIILLTSLSEKAEQLRGLGLGADDYLSKPFDMGLLIQRIKSILRNRDIVREKALKLINGYTDEPILSNELNDIFVKKMLDVVKANISNTDFNKNDFAAEMNVSSSLLYKKIKSLTGQSPTDFIKSIRMNHSLELIKTRKYSVTEISEMSGFASVAYFSTVFRKYFGKSPTDILP